MDVSKKVFSLQSKTLGREYQRKSFSEESEYLENTVARKVIFKITIK